MNVLLLSTYVSAEVGGGEFVHALIAELLAKNGHKVWIITNKVEGIKNPVHENIKYHYVAHQKVERVKKQKQIEKIKFNFDAVKTGLSIIKKEKINIIHSNPLQPVLAGAILSILTSVPHIIALHDIAVLKKEYLEGWAKIKGNSKLKAKLGFLINSFIYKLKYAAIHTVSEAVKDDLIKWGVKKPIYVISNAIPMREAENIPTNPFQFVYVGRLVFYKNIEVAIKAIKIVKESFPNVKLIIVGEGTYNEYLKELVNKLDLEENVIFKGQTSEQEKTKLIATSQAVVFPSLHEGFGMVILEAFSQKKPVMVSNVRPLSDIVKHRKTGLVISAHDEKEWAKWFEHILKNPETVSKMGESGKIELQKLYNLESMENRVLKMYEEVIK